MIAARAPRSLYAHERGREARATKTPAAPQLVLTPSPYAGEGDDSPVALAGRAWRRIAIEHGCDPVLDLAREPTPGRKRKLADRAAKGVVPVNLGKGLHGTSDCLRGDLVKPDLTGLRNLLQRRQIAHNDHRATGGQSLQRRKAIPFRIRGEDYRPRSR